MVLLSKKDNVIYQKALGEFESPKISSQFVIGSVSKQFTAVLILRLVERGLIELKDPVGKYCPDLTGNWDSPVQISHLLNHTSGISEYNKPLAFNPGSDFLYANANYDILGQIIEKVTSINYSTHLEDLFKELGMHASIAPSFLDINKVKAQYPDFVVGNVTTEEGAQLPSIGEVSLSAGGIVTTCHDLVSWTLALHNGKVLETKMYQEMVSTKVKNKNNRWGEVGYGYGIQIDHTDNLIEIGHSGILAGYIATLLYYPQHKITLVILENQILWPKTWSIRQKQEIFKNHDSLRAIIRKHLLPSKEPFAHQ